MTLLTKQQACAKLNCCDRVLRQFIKNGKLPVIDTTGNARGEKIDLDDLEKLIDSLRVNKSIQKALNLGRLGRMEVVR